MKREFIVERQGRSFVLYAGLLDLAHSQGLQSIRTELIQIPSEDNGRASICFATVTMKHDGIETQFTGIGDANPANVPVAMQQCLIRMSETRAKARALRDAVNVGVASLEEMADDEPHSNSNRSIMTGGFSNANRSGVQRSPESKSNKSSSTPVYPQPIASLSVSSQLADKSEAANVCNLLLKPQRDAIRCLCRRGGMDDDAKASELFGVTTADSLTHSQACDLIKSLQENIKRSVKTAA